MSQVRISAQAFQEEQQAGRIEEYLRGSGFDPTKPGEVRQECDQVVVSDEVASGPPLTEVLSSFQIEQQKVEEAATPPPPELADVSGASVGSTVRSQPEGEQNTDVPHFDKMTKADLMSWLDENSSYEVSSSMTKEQLRSLAVETYENPEGS